MWWRVLCRSDGRTLAAGLRGTGIVGGWFLWLWPRIQAEPCRLSGGLGRRGRCGGESRRPSS